MSDEENVSLISDLHRFQSESLCITDDSNTKHIWLKKTHEIEQIDFSDNAHEHSAQQNWNVLLSWWDSKEDLSFILEVT